MQGLLGGLPPGLAGFVAQRQMAGQDQDRSMNQAQGLLSMQQAMQGQQEMQRKNQLRGLLSEAIQSGDQQKVMGVMAQISPESMAQQFMPKPPQKFDLGDRIEIRDEAGNVLQTLMKGVTPDTSAKEEGDNKRHATPSGSAALGAQTTMRGQDMTHSLGRANLGVSQARLNFDMSQPRGQYDSDRGVWVQPGGVATPVTMGGAPLAPKERPLTESQGKGSMFGTRAAESDRILRGLEDKISTTGLAAKRAVADLPVVGAPLGVAGNSMLSQNQQKVEQAQRDFVNAVLRQESGAVISPQEFENAQKQYFPQPGDGREVREQKRKNRQTAVDGFKVMAGPAANRINAAQGGTTGEWTVQEIK